MGAVVPRARGVRAIALGSSVHESPDWVTVPVIDVERIVKPLNQLVFVAFGARRTEGASLIANEQAEGPRANTQRPQRSEDERC